MNFENIDLVMGWDIGDGDTVVYALNVHDENPKMFCLNVHESRAMDVVISAVSRQNNGRIIIGDDVERQSDFAVNFKRSPENWDNKSGQSVTYKQHMSDFIRGVSNAILKNSHNRTELYSVISVDENDNAEWKPDKVLLVAGCPAADIWKKEENRKLYEALISEATGIENVIVVEESRAAVFSLFATQELCERVNLQKGVLVLDLGSSTADATCIIPGEKAVHLSWQLGAAGIEKAMLSLITNSGETKALLKKYAVLFDREQVFPDMENCDHAILNLRRAKEDYYDGKWDGVTGSENVALNLIDENNDPIMDEDKKSEKISVKYKVTDEMMRYAVGEHRTFVKENNNIVSIGTWEEHCRNFMLTAKMKLEINGIEPDSVIVTGGGSKMPFVTELAKEVFGADNIIRSDAPSHSVVRGLATIAFNSLKEDDVREAVSDRVSTDARKNVSKMLSDISYGLAEKAFEECVSALESKFEDEHNAYPDWEKNIRFLTNMLDWDLTVGEISDATQKALNESLEKNGGLIFGSALTEWDNSDKQLIVDSVNDAVEDLYSDKAFQSMIAITHTDVDAMKKDLRLPGVSIPPVGPDSNITAKILGVVIKLILLVVLCVVLGEIIPVLGPLLAGLIAGVAGESITEVLQEKRGMHVPLGGLSVAVTKMRREKDTHIRDIKTVIYNTLYAKFTDESVYGKDFHKHYTVLEETANKAIDRILLIAEEE